jgi:prostaglandin reductase 1
VKARKWVLAKHFEGLPKRSDLVLKEEELPPLEDGEFLAEAVYLSVDPYMRPYSYSMKLGETMMGEQVARIAESRSVDFSVGDFITGRFGWRSHSISTPKDQKMGIRKINPALSQPISTAIGVLGMPGATAYFGLYEILTPKEGETIVVSGAAGAVGSAVGQLAKLKGCRVVGFAGSEEKVAYLKEIGFDVAYNYKKVESLFAALKEGCPNGIDMYFDNVGGDMTDAVFPLLNNFARVSVCGVISTYNTGPHMGPSMLPYMVTKQIKMEGFLVNRWIPMWPEAFQKMDQLIQEGKLSYKETVTEGFDNMFDAFMGLFKGENTGKALVKSNL